MCAGQSFVHVDDLSDAVAELIERRSQLPKELPLLIGENEALGYAEVQNVVGQTLHKENCTTLRMPQEVARLDACLEENVLAGMTS